MRTMDTHPLLDTLTDPERFTTLDPHDMLGLVRAFPQQCRQAVAIGRQSWQGVAPRGAIRQVVVSGVGGSAIGGDLARCLMDEYGAVPLIVNRDYTLPQFVGPETLLVAVSYSGDTEETLAATAAAKKAGAQLAAITSGGKLRTLAEADGIPLALVPGGQPPRSATGYLFFPLIACLARFGLLTRDLTADVEETLARLETLAAAWGPDVPTTQNPAKQLAVALHGRLPVLYGSQGYRGAVAYRWKSQINENAKEAAFANVLPEQNHNEILAWTLAQRQAQTWAVVFLRDPRETSEAPRIARRVEVTRALIADAADVQEAWAEGDSLLARMFHLLYLGDFASVYLAYLNGVCPTDIGAINHLKAELAKSG